MLLDFGGVPFRLKVWILILGICKFIALITADLIKVPIYSISCDCRHGEKSMLAK